MNLPDTQMITRQSSQIKNIAEEMNRLNNENLRNAADNISAVWRGEAANVYLRHCSTTRDEIRNTANELLNIANELDLIVRQLEASGIK